MSNSKIIFVIMDGGADRPQPELNGLTPFEAAKTPMFDLFAKKGKSGQITFLQFDPKAPNLPGPTSDQAHLMLLGESDEYSNRGEFMAWGIGLNPQKGDLCCRAYLKSRIGETLIRFSPTLSREEASQIEKRFTGHMLVGTDKNEEIGVILKFDPFKDLPRWGSLLLSTNSNLGQSITTPDQLPKLEYFSHDEKVFQALCKLNLDDNVLPSNVDKILSQIRCDTPGDQESMKSAELLKVFVKRTIDSFINEPYEVSAFKMLAGMIQPTEPAISYGPRETFSSKWNKPIKCASFTEKIEVHGVMRALSFNCANRCSRLIDSVNEVKNSLNENDFIFLQFKDTDNLSHDNDVIGKLRLIEKVDSFVSELYNEFPDATFVITADHTTPCGLYQRIHTREPVPVVLCGKEIKSDSVEMFGEKYAHQGALGLIEAKEFMSVLRDKVQI